MFVFFHQNQKNLSVLMKAHLILTKARYALSNEILGHKTYLIRT
ncbi:hypothetical protein LLB_1610 [Legionella longbeachae D-4968]|nr:hypothetical protein LLB_1610 [Legionella longbeachae D-4968]